MIPNFFFGFTSGSLLGFILHWFFKKPLSISSISKEQVHDPNEIMNVESNFTGEEPYWMALCVNDDLKMTKGKAMAQCSHAAVGVYESYFKTRKSAFDVWEKQGKHISMFKVTDGIALESLGEAAESYNFITCLVRDAGRTQIPSGSITVLAIGPARKSELDRITQYLLPYT